MCSSDLGSRRSQRGRRHRALAPHREAHRWVVRWQLWLLRQRQHYGAETVRCKKASRSMRCGVRLPHAPSEPLRVGIRRAHLMCKALGSYLLLALALTRPHPLLHRQHAANHHLQQPRHRDASKRFPRQQALALLSRPVRARARSQHLLGPQQCHKVPQTARLAHRQCQVCRGLGRTHRWERLRAPLRPH